MQYTLRQVPLALDEALRRRAKVEGTSLNGMVLRMLARALGLDGEQEPRRSLSDIGGTWHRDAACEHALADQDRVDEDLWR